jgi:SMI1 / KNR4 family (SUKH-1)
VDEELLDRIRSDPRSSPENPVTKKRIREVEKEIGHAFPAAFIRFHLEFGGGEYPFARMMSLKHAPRGPRPYARGAGVEQVELGSCELTEHLNLLYAFEPPRSGLVPFGDDWGGNVYCFDTAARSEAGECPIVQVDHERVSDPPDEIADTFADFVTSQWLHDDDDVKPRPSPRRESIGDVVALPKTIHVVEFDACRSRKPGDAARHSVFDALSIQATVEDLSQLFDHASKKPDPIFGFAVRLRAAGLVKCEGLKLTDGRERPLSLQGASIGHSRRGNEPSILIFAWGPRPFPEKTRLRLELSVGR